MGVGVASAGGRLVRVLRPLDSAACDLSSVHTITLVHAHQRTHCLRLACLGGTCACMLGRNLRACINAMHVCTRARMHMTRRLRIQPPGVDFSLIESEQDVLWSPDHRETKEEIQARGEGGGRGAAEGSRRWRALSLKPQQRRRRQQPC
jgi:hypothetical protein